jgi:hypothetical protein
MPEIKNPEGESPPWLSLSGFFVSRSWPTAAGLTGVLDLPDLFDLPVNSPP